MSPTRSLTNCSGLIPTRLLTSSRHQSEGSVSPFRHSQDRSYGKSQLTCPTAATPRDAAQRTLQPTDQMLAARRLGQGGCGGDQLADSVEGPYLRLDRFVLRERLTLAGPMRF
jgi:hypothetical protein